MIEASAQYQRLPVVLLEVLQQLQREQLQRRRLASRFRSGPGGRLDDTEAKAQASVLARRGRARGPRVRPRDRGPAGRGDGRSGGGGAQPRAPRAGHRRAGRRGGGGARAGGPRRGGRPSTTGAWRSPTPTRSDATTASRLSRSGSSCSPCGASSRARSGRRSRACVGGGRRAERAGLAGGRRRARRIDRRDSGAAPVPLHAVGRAPRRAERRRGPGGHCARRARCFGSMTKRQQQPRPGGVATRACRRPRARSA